MSPFDVFIAYVSWHDGGKRRPILIQQKNTKYTKAFRITTKFDSKSTQIKARYFEINDWKQAGLAKQSYIDTMKSIEVPTNYISSQIGRLSESDIRRLLEFI